MKNPKEAASELVSRLAYELYCRRSEPYRVFADKLGIDVRTLHRRLEPGRASRLKLSDLAALAWVLDLDLEFGLRPLDVPPVPGET